jgi:septum formation protein
MISQLSPINPVKPEPRRLILASTSVYRRELLMRLKLPFACVAPGGVGTPGAAEAPLGVATRLAREKAAAVARQYDALVIGADQVLECDGKALGKPGDRDGARRQLLSLSGRSVRFHSAVCVLDARSNQPAEGVTAIDVRFRALTLQTIERYLDLEPAFDCVGSAKAEGLGIALLASVTSTDPTALIGLPLILLVDLLRAHDYPIFDTPVLP